MKYLQVVQAAQAIESIQQLRLPYAKARKIYEISKKLRCEYEFYANEEAKLVNEYAVKGENGRPIIRENGMITFPDLEAKEAYSHEILKLNEMFVEMRIEPVTLTAAEIGTQTIQPEAISRLEGIIIFE